MQRPLITIEGGKPKGRLGWLSAWVVTSLALFMPLKLRIVFTIAINFIYNHIFATTRLGLFFAARVLSRVLIFLVYWFVLGPSSLAARLLGRDYLGLKEAGDSHFKPKEPADESAERFERQY